MEQPTMTLAEANALIAKLTAENAKLVASVPAPKPLTLKVSEKGAISIYGLGKWPTTLYRSQMEKLLGHDAAIKQFIQANEAQLSSKT